MKIHEISTKKTNIFIYIYKFSITWKDLLIEFVLLFTFVWHLYYSSFDIALTPTSNRYATKKKGEREKEN